MGIIVRQALKGSIYSYIGVALGFIITAKLLPNLFSTEQVGLLKILISFSVVFVQIGNLGFNSVTIRKFAYFRNIKNNHNGFLFIALVYFIIGLILFLVIFFILQPILIEKNVEKSALLSEYFFYIIPLVFFTQIFTFLDVYYSVLMNAARGTFLKEVLQRIAIIISVSLYWIDLIDFNQFLFLYIVSFCIPSIIIIIALIREKQINLKPNFNFLNKTLIFSIISVSLFGSLNNFTSVFIFNIDSLMINSMIGLSATGIYSIMFFFGAIIKIPARSLIKISNVVIAESWKNNDLKNISDIYYKSTINQSIIGVLFFLGIWGNINNILRFIPEEYAAGKFVILFISLGNLIDMITGVNGSIIGTSEKYKYQTAFMIFLLILVVGFNYLFIPIWGISGAAIASMLAQFLFNLTRYLFLVYTYKMQPFRFRHLIIFILGVVSYLISLLIPQIENLIIDLFIRSIALSLIFLLPVYFLNLSEDINIPINKLINFGIKKFK